MPHIVPSGIQVLGKAYPACPAPFRHDLSGHELLGLDALADAALRLNPDKVDRRPANIGKSKGGDFTRLKEDRRPVDVLIRNLGDSDNWMGLCGIETLPEYRALLQEIMDEVAPIAEPRTGKGLGMVGFVFISPPNAFTPYHFDAEHNILFHISGRKQFAVFPVSPPFVEPDVQEHYFLNGNNLLPWRDEFADGGEVFSLEPGDALHVPFGAPHWVKVGSQPSVSLSLTWQSSWSDRSRNALKLNHALREKGWGTFAPPVWPRNAAIRSTVYRAAHKVGWL